MPKLEWDKTNERLYETGVDCGVFYAQDDNGTYPKGEAWNGLTAVNEKPTGADVQDIYADNLKYLSLRAAEKFEAGIEAYTYPDGFVACDGGAQPVPGIRIGQQTRKAFGLAYRTKIGNDTEFDDYGYKIHMIWGATVSPSERNYATINDTPEAISMSWDLSTTPVKVTGYKPTASMEIDSTKFTEEQMQALEDILFGTDPAEGESGTGTVARLPLPDEIIALFRGEDPEDPEDPEEGNEEDVTA